MAECAVGIVGLGLIGGSLARALVAAGVRVFGTARDAEDARRAAAHDVVVVSGVERLASETAALDVVVLAAPITALSEVAQALLPGLAPHVAVLHVGGLQRPDALQLGGASRTRVIGTHPMAGSHGQGFAASRADLFAGATVWAEARADAATRARLEWLWDLAGAATVRYETAAAHDAAMAWVSHLPQLAATALAGALAAAGVPPDAGGPGLRDATRLAASPLPLWRDVLGAAPSETDAALAGLAAAVEQLRGVLARGDTAALDQLWARAGAWRGAAPAPIPPTPDRSRLRAAASATDGVARATGAAQSGVPQTGAARW